MGTYLSFMALQKQSIAIVDDDERVCRALSRLVRILGFDVTTYNSCESFLSVAEDRPPECVLLDMHLPGMKGIDLLEHRRGPLTMSHIIAMTGFDTPEMRNLCLRAGAAAYLTKPITLEELEQALLSRQD